MDSSTFAVRVYRYCTSHRLLRPISTLLRAVHMLYAAQSRLSLLVEKVSGDPGLPVTSPTVSFWQDPPHASLYMRQSPQLGQEYDVVIVGSGITAASTAEHLLTLDPNISVTILEARNLCSGATGRNGGHILELPYEDFDMRIAQLGLEEAKKLIRFRLAHLENITSFVDTRMTEAARKVAESRRVEVVNVVYDSLMWERTKRQLETFIAHFPEHGHEWKVYEGKQAEVVFGIRNALGAITGPAGAIWPYRFVTGIYEGLLQDYGNRFTIETNTPVVRIATTMTNNKYPYLVETTRGSLYGKNIVHATNGHAGHLLPRLRGKIFPIRGQMTVQSLPNQDLAEATESKSWILTHSRGFDYMTRNPHTGDYFLGGGLLQGGNGGLDDIGNPRDDKEDLPAIAHLRGALSQMFSASSNGAGEESTSPVLKHSWSGTIGFSCDGLPWVGKVPASISMRSTIDDSLEDQHCGEWVAAGFCGNGMVYCWLSGKAIASMIVGQDVSSWFPKCLIPTTERFRCASVEEVGMYWMGMES